MVVTDMAVGADGTIYAATIPNGRIFKSADGAKWDLFCKLECQYVWSMVFDQAGNIVAGTGPGGKIYRIRADGRAEVLCETKRENVLCVVSDGAGGFHVGTAGNGAVFRVSSDGKISLVADFAEGEVKDIVVMKDGTLCAAVNGATKMTPQDFIKAISDATPKPPSDAKAPVDQKPAPSVSAAVMRILNGGGSEEVVTFPNTYLTDAACDSDGDVLVATSSSGRVFKVRKDGSFLIVLDAAEKQVLTMLMKDGTLAGVGTGDAGAAYVPAEGAAETSYFSEVIDSRFPSIWGALSWSPAKGLGVQTRSGNTAKPDGTWSEWSTQQGESPAKVSSPQARYLQFRVNWGADASARLKQVTLYFRNSNQRPKIQQVDIEDTPFEGGQRVTESQIGGPAPRSVMKKIRWQAQDPNGDTLAFRVDLLPEGAARWIPISGPALFRGNEFVWNTEHYPDGKYVIRVEATDEQDNIQGEALKHEKESAPFVVDNTKPNFVEITVGKDGLCAVTVSDATSNIAQLEFCVDGGAWQKAGPLDGMCDGTMEKFAFRASGVAGGHVLVLRATETAGNYAVVQREFKIE
jgi:hypothetical protein